MRCTSPSKGCGFLLAITSLVSVSQAALLQTDPNGLAFYATDTTATSGFYEILNTGTDINGTIYSPPNPGLNGSVVWIAGQLVGTGGEVDTDLSNGLDSYAEYTVQFSSQGTYRVYWAGQRTGDPQIVAEGSTVGGNDSVWIGPVNQDHTGTADWTQLSLAAGGITYRSSGALWVIDGSNVNTDLTLTIGLREDGPIYDRVAFVLEGSGVTPEQIEVIPEPTSVALILAAAGLAAACGHRRRWAATFAPSGLW